MTGFADYLYPFSSQVQLKMYDCIFTPQLLKLLKTNILGRNHHLQIDAESEHALTCRPTCSLLSR